MLTCQISRIRFRCAYLGIIAAEAFEGDFFGFMLHKFFALCEYETVFILSLWFSLNVAYRLQTIVKKIGLPPRFVAQNIAVAAIEVQKR